MQQKNNLTDAEHAGLNPAALQRRANWLRLVMKWHWISSALCLVGILFFALSGLTLNNAEYVESTATSVTRHSGTLPADVLAILNTQGPAAGADLPADLRTWVSSTWGLKLAPKSVDWQTEEVFIDLKRPGVDAWLSIDRRSGMVQYEAADHGWVAFINDLHKGKNAGRVWSWLINLFGVGCLVFSVTGLLILQIHAKSKWTIWPITGLGLILPLILFLLFVH